MTWYLLDLHYIPFFSKWHLHFGFVPRRGASLINLKRGSWFLALVRMQLKSKIYCFMLLKDQKYNLHTGFFNAIVERFRNIFPKFFFTQHFGISHYPTNVYCLWHANLICFLFFLFFKKKTLWRNFQLFKDFGFLFLILQDSMSCVKCWWWKFSDSYLDKFIHFLT